MKRQDIQLKNKERYLNEYKLDKNKLEKAFGKAVDKLIELDKKFGDKFPGVCSDENNRYPAKDKVNWVSGLYTGMYWLAYEYTKDDKFRKIAESHFGAYEAEVKDGLKIRTHDVGFIYSPSLVAQYKVTGDKAALDTALKTAELFYNDGWDKDGKFIIRSFDYRDTDWGNRTMVDALFNAPLFLWAYEETGDEKYLESGLGQNLTVERNLIREDNSTYHHYAFECGTGKPLYGCTLQGHSDESCWSRGHSWCVYGFPICYSYTKNETLIKAHRDVTYYFLNHLPENLIPCWDFIFDEPNTEPRDSSAAAISVCGMLEMAKHLPDDSEDKIIFRNAAAMILDSLMDNCTNDYDTSDGLLSYVTAAVPQGMGIDGCAMYGDYYYLEALMRFLNPDWKMYW